MQEIIQKKFDEWTRHLNPEESTITIYEHIRNIPYFRPGAADPYIGPAELLIQNRGHCVPKHILLGMMYNQLGIPVQYAVYPFRWGSQDILYPDSLRRTADELPVMYHTALKAYKGRWILVDATWDPLLKKVGFPVTENWDGCTDTRNAVTPIEETVYTTLQEGTEYITSKIHYTVKQDRLIEAFCSELNTWLQKIRKNKVIS
jgi:RNAse (barnase) inhibitor barstar